MATGNGQPRTYIIATETAVGAGKVNANMLKAEIAVDPAGIPAPQDGRVDTGSGNLDIYFVSPLSVPHTTALDAVVLAHQGIVTTGRNQSAKSSAISGTILSALQDKLAKTIKAVRAGDYLLTATFELRLVGGTSGSGVRGLVELDGTETNETNVDHNGQWSLFTAIGVVVFAEGDTPEIKIRWRRLGSDGTAEIRRARVVIAALDLDN